jgi:hypothetical protein
VSDQKPPLGKNPFEAEIAANTNVSSSITIVPSHTLPRDLDSSWFQQQQKNAEKGIAQIEALSGWMEVRFVPETDINKSARELLEAVQNSEIKTFGWPIGVTLQNRPEYRPTPTDSGIRAEIGIEESQLSGRSSYDYWALTRNADFFLLQSYFEDMRSENRPIFFNTRIVRVAESFLFAANLYAHFGMGPATKLRVRFKHKGLKGRALSSSSPNRPIFEKQISVADETETTLIVAIGDIRKNVTALVRDVCAPMFEQFDFMHFGDTVYDDIVQNFVNGVVT